MPRQVLRTKDTDLVRLTQAFNDSRDTANDFQKLLKGVIKGVMDDFIRLQHPSTRDEPYIKEAFQMALAALYDDDWKTDWPGPHDTRMELSFREILFNRFGLDNINRREIQKLDIEPLRKELISEAKEYWLNRKLAIVQPTDFICFDGEAYTVWRVPEDDESSVDSDSKILYVRKQGSDKQNSIEYIRVSLLLMAELRDLDLTDEQIEKLAPALWELLRMNNCFRGEKC